MGPIGEFCLIWQLRTWTVLLYLLLSGTWTNRGWDSETQVCLFSVDSVKMGGYTIKKNTQTLVKAVFINLPRL